VKSIGWIHWITYLDDLDLDGVGVSIIFGWKDMICEVHEEKCG